MFQIPPIIFDENIPPLTRQNYTTRSILTVLRNGGFRAIADQAVPNQENFQNDQHLMTWLSANISTMIEECLHNSDERLISNIFHSIQIWGGIQARGFYLANNNFNLEAYDLAIKSARNGDVNEAIRLLRNNYKQLNIAFASKHFSFWTVDLNSDQNNGPRQLPILDRIIFNLLYGRSSPDYRHYSFYLTDIYNFLANNQHLTAQTIERHLFNYADTVEGREWIRNRMNR